MAEPIPAGQHPSPARDRSLSALDDRSTPAYDRSGQAGLVRKNLPDVASCLASSMGLQSHPLERVRAII
jgi:hypothetical protein